MKNLFIFGIVILIITAGATTIESEKDTIGCCFVLVPSLLTSFDTGQGEYPSISGTHNGTIIPFHDIKVNTLYTYPCAGTGGHTEYARIWNSSLDINAVWNGYKNGWHNTPFNKTFVLYENETYNYTIRTGSYPQIHHNTSLLTVDGWINCTSFVDVNGKVYKDWIPSIKLCELKN